ncbi:MAG TPA: glycoside hydrolase family 130 protein [Bacteroidales bacterium]|nr:glycoside hydrolase family 130 protein [Bacteroidales bacterium]HPT01879.1 glycoside hydrolase family 130 protein [Bacteroidales bacterium]
MKRHPKNPIITRDDIPPIPPELVDATSAFNPGAIKDGNIYRLMLRVQGRSRETFLVMAQSPDGVNFSVENRIVHFKGIENVKGRIFHTYDARITNLEGRFYIMFAMDMEDGCQLGLGVTDDFRDFDFLGLTSNEDIRNGVLFPEKVNGKYLRMDRPNKARHTGGPTSGSTIWLSGSDNLIDWTPVAPLIDGRFHYWDEFIGSGPPPVKTRKGWLHVYHGVAGHFGSANIYQGGVMLLDLKDPSKVLGRCRCNILEPREIWELAGQVPNVTFPSGMIVEAYDREGFAIESSEVKIYYGAADTSVGLLISTVKELLDASMEGDIPCFP